MAIRQLGKAYGITTLAKEVSGEEMSRAKAAMVGLVCLGWVVRVWGIGFGIPADYHFDEQHIDYAVLYSAGNWLRPDRFWQPSLYRYLVMSVFAAIYVGGMWVGTWSNAAEYLTAFIANPTVWLYAGRLLNAGLGVVQIYLVYEVGKRWYGQRVGLVAMWFMVWAFGHVQESHYVKEDILLGLLGWGVHFVCYLISKAVGTRRYQKLGLLIGLMAAVKYNFFVFLTSVVGTWWFDIRTRRGLVMHKWLVVGVVAVGVFGALNPYFFLELPRAVTDLTLQVRMNGNQSVSSEGLPVWWYYMVYHLPYGMGVGVWLVSLVGICVVILKGGFKERILASGPVTFVGVLAIFGGFNFARYGVVIMPPLVVLAALVVTRVVRSNKGVLLAVMVLTAQPMMEVVRFDYLLTRPDTRKLAQTWIENNIPEGVKIVVEGTVRDQYKSVFGPGLWPSRKLVAELISQSNQVGSSVVYLEALQKVVKYKRGYNIGATVRLDKRYAPDVGGYVPVKVAEYLAEGYCYVVSSSWAKGDRTANYNPDFWTDFDKHYVELIAFRPNPEFAEDLAWRVDFERLGKIQASDAIVSGPLIKVYQSRDLLRGGYCL